MTAKTVKTPTHNVNSSAFVFPLIQSFFIDVIERGHRLQKKSKEKIPGVKGKSKGSKQKAKCVDVQVC